MMGERRVMQEALFYAFSLERHVPDDHMLRRIDRFVDLSGVRAHLEPYYSDVGRPSIDPELKSGYCLSATASASAPSDGCARKSTSIWPTVGSADWVSTAAFPTIRPSRRTGMAASARAICCAISLRASSRAAWRKDWWAAKPSRSTPA